jgi:hypothetical protein
MIFNIFLAVIVLALILRQCRRQIKRTQMNKLYVSEAYRKAMLEKADECDLTEHELAATNRSRKRFGLPPWSTKKADDDTKTYPPGGGA